MPEDPADEVAIIVYSRNVVLGEITLKRVNIRLDFVILKAYSHIYGDKRFSRCLVVLDSLIHRKQYFKRVVKKTNLVSCTICIRIAALNCVMWDTFCSGKLEYLLFLVSGRSLACQ